MSHLIILDRSKAFGEKLADGIATVTLAHTLVENNLVTNSAAINDQIDLISDFLSDHAADLEGLVAGLTALLPE